MISILVKVWYQPLINEESNDNENANHHDRHSQYLNNIFSVHANEHIHLKYHFLVYAKRLIVI